MPDDGILWYEPVWSSRVAFRQLLRPALTASLRLWGVVLPSTAGAMELLIAINSWKAARPIPLGLTLVTIGFGILMVPFMTALELMTSWAFRPSVLVTPDKLSFTWNGWKWLAQAEVARAEFRRDLDRGDVLVLERSTPHPMMRRTVAIPPTANLAKIKRVVSMWDCNRGASRVDPRPRVQEGSAAF
jgi:hypothetical protein